MVKYGTREEEMEQKEKEDKRRDNEKRMKIKCNEEQEYK